MSHCTSCGVLTTEGDHTVCAQRRPYEPPRYCAQCARRMVVQVTPLAWTARCSVHGLSRSGEPVKTD